MLGMYSSDGY